MRDEQVNRGPLRGAAEFFVNEEWLWAPHDREKVAHLRHYRLDPDDEAVRVRPVAQDDALLAEVASRAPEVAPPPEQIRNCDWCTALLARANAEGDEPTQEGIEYYELTGHFARCPCRTEEIIHIDEAGRVVKSTVLGMPEREGPCESPTGGWQAGQWRDCTLSNGQAMALCLDCSNVFITRQPHPCRALKAQRVSGLGEPTP